jgi:hypothetical protein
MKIVTCLLANIIFAIFISQFIICSSIGIGGLKKGKNSHKRVKVEPKVEPKLEEDVSPDKDKQELPNLPVYFKGWIKYLHYSESSKNKPKAFYKNIAFEEQSKKVASNELRKTDEVFFENNN